MFVKLPGSLSRVTSLLGVCPSSLWVCFLLSNFHVHLTVKQEQTLKGCVRIQEVVVHASNSSTWETKGGSLCESRSAWSTDGVLSWAARAGQRPCRDTPPPTPPKKFKSVSRTTKDSWTSRDSDIIMNWARKVRCVWQLYFTSFFFNYLIFETGSLFVVLTVLELAV